MRPARPLALLLAVVSLYSTRALASTPSPGDSDVPCGINLVGYTGSTVDVRGEFTVVVRDASRNPVPGALVLIDFRDCSDLRICSVQIQRQLTADCRVAIGTISAVTDGSGTARLRIVGGARNVARGTPGAGFKCATVYADQVNLGKMNVGAYDENGAGGVNPADLSVFLSDAFAYPGVFVGRSDFNCSNSINPTDLSLLLSTSLSGGSVSSCASYCQ